LKSRVDQSWGRIELGQNIGPFYGRPHCGSGAKDNRPIDQQRGPFLLFVRSPWLEFLLVLQGSSSPMNTPRDNERITLPSKHELQCILIVSSISRKEDDDDGSRFSSGNRTSAAQRNSKPGRGQPFILSARISSGGEREKRLTDPSIHDYRWMSV